MFKFHLIIGAAIFFLGCGSPAAPPDSIATEDQPGEVSSLSFAFSQSRSGRGDNMCKMPLPEAAVISAHPENSGLRLFTLAGGPHRVVIDYGNIASSFILQKKGNIVEVFTSDNYPECLSNKANFVIKEGGNSFQYNNNKHIVFDVHLLPLANGTQIALEIDPDAGYGIIVRR